MVLLVKGNYLKRFSILLDKADKSSREGAHQAIQNWLDQRQGDPSLLPDKLVFPVEGWYTNASKLLPFKHGAFKPGKVGHFSHFLATFVHLARIILNLRKVKGV